MTTKYILTGTHFAGELELQYDLNGHLTAFYNRAELSDKQLGFLGKNFPVTMEQGNALIAQTKMKATLIPADLSFATFWNLYDYKVGNKPRAQKLWDKLTEGEKIEVLLSIKEYDRYLDRKKGIEKLYPETYLHQERWKVEYRSLK